MELTRLQELTAVAKKTAITEATKHEKDFDGIRNVVDDCLADLKDKLGKGGNLATLMKSSGASKLDTYKDASGKNVGKQIIDLTTEYCKAVEKLMTEAEILVSQVNEGQLTEAKDYDDSSDFTDEFYGLFDHVNKVKAAIKNPRWMKWMKTTDTNFGTETEAPARAAIAAIGSLGASLDDIDAELDKAS